MKKNTLLENKKKNRFKFTAWEGEGEKMEYTITYPENKMQEFLETAQNKIPFGRYTPILIIGTGIAGSLIANELEKRNFAYMLITDQMNAAHNNTNISYANCRIPNRENIINTIENSVSEYSQDRKIADFVYRNAGLAERLFNELKIEYKKTPFGIMPAKSNPGGKEILSKLQENCSEIITGIKVTDINQINPANGLGNYEVIFDRNGFYGSILARRVVLAIGGAAGQNKITDNIAYPNQSIFNAVKKIGGTVVDPQITFYHPFGYNEGKNILIGDEIIKGKFTDESGNRIFSPDLENRIKKNNYHESFPQILSEMQKIISMNKKVIFQSQERTLKISPTAHYTLGGIVTDALGRVKGCPEMYAAGECRSDGINCRGRLPGYPMTAAIVQGYKIADDLEKKAKLTRKRINY